MGIGLASNAGSLQRRRLGIELRRLREAAKLTLEQVAARFEWSVSKASRQELGRIPITRRDVGDLLTLYGVEDPEQRETLLSLTRIAKERDWWTRYDEVTPKQFSIFLGFEADATSILTYETLLIPGLLQTADYCRALIRARHPQDSEESTERRVSARVERQAILSRESPPELWAIIDESAIRREVGGPIVMAGQLTHLVKLDKRPNITLQVLPLRAGAHASMESGFIVLGFAEPTDREVACLDMLTRSVYMEDPEEVGRYRSAFERLRANAASPADSTRLIAAVAKEMAR